VRADAVFDPSRFWGADRTTADRSVHPREGDEDLSEGSDSDPPAKGGRHKRRTGRDGKSTDARRSKAGELGKALRSVYDTTLREDIPRDFLDLLGKLS
jgi:hypothetical protein